MTVFVDTAVIMYASGGDHPLRGPCEAVLTRIADGQLDAVISVEVIQEILHRFIALGQRSTGVVMATGALDLFAPVLPVTHATMRKVMELTESHPTLSARDLVHAATCLQEGITDIVSPDRGFDSVPGLRRLDPAAAAR